MRILFLSTWFPSPPDNGSKIRVYHLLRALSIRHEVSLLSFAFDMEVVPDKEDMRRLCIDVEVVSKNPFRRSMLANALRFFSPGPVVTRPVPEMAQAVHNSWARKPYQLVVASTAVMGAYALSLPRHIPRVLEEHNSWSRYMRERYQRQTTGLARVRCWWSWQKARHYEGNLFRQFDLCVMPSVEDRDASVRDLPGYTGQVAVIPNGVDCEHNQFDDAVRQSPTLVFNGALTYNANFDAMAYFMADIYPSIRRAFPGASLAITGSTANVDLDSLRLDESITFTGYVNDVRPMVAGAQVCVIPLRQGGGTRLKVLEAMALGTPVVSTSKGVEGLEVVDGEHVLLADGPEMFASQTIRLLSDPLLCRRLSANARRLMEQRYDWKRIGTEFCSLIESTCVPRQTLGDRQRIVTKP